jgi:hypothetical protein
MDIKKGIFRLALVLSILVGIIPAVVTFENLPVRTYIAVKKIDPHNWVAYKFDWEERGFSQMDIMKVFLAIDREEGSDKKEMVTLKGWEFLQQKTGQRIYPLEYYPPEIEEQASKFLMDEKWDRAKYGNRVGILDEITYTNWKKFITVMAISAGSVWALWTFIRLIVIAYIVEGFKGKPSSHITKQKGGELNRSLSKGEKLVH